MDTSSMVKNDIENGLRLLEQLVRDGINVTIAFWVRFLLEETGPWFYIVSNAVDRKGLQVARRELHDSIRRIPLPWRPWSSDAVLAKLRLIGAEDPLARDVLAVRAQFPGKNRFRGVRIGDQLVDELVIYQYNLPGILLAVAALGSAKKNVPLPWWGEKGTADEQWMDALEHLRRELDLGPNPLEWRRRIGIGPESNPVKTLLRQIGDAVSPLLFPKSSSEPQQDEAHALEKLGSLAWGLRAELEKEIEMPPEVLRQIWPESEPKNGANTLRQVSETPASGVA